MDKKVAAEVLQRINALGRGEAAVIRDTCKTFLEDAQKLFAAVLPMLRDDKVRRQMALSLRRAKELLALQRGVPSNTPMPIVPPNDVFKNAVDSTFGPAENNAEQSTERQQINTLQNHFAEVVILCSQITDREASASPSDTNTAGTTQSTQPAKDQKPPGGTVVDLSLDDLADTDDGEPDFTLAPGIEFKKPEDEELEEPPQ